MRAFAVVALAAVGAIVAATGACGEVVEPSVETVAVTPPQVNLVAGEQAQLVAETRIAGDVVVADREITWTSSNPAVATVTPDGRVTAVAPGDGVTITATSDGRAGTATIAVTGPVATVTVGPSSLPPMIVGATAQLVADARDAAGRPVPGRRVTWTSSDQDIGRIAATGLLVANGIGGPVTITATVDGVSGTLAGVTTVPGIITGIADMVDFLDRCPTGDPAFATIVQDFQLRENGVLLAAPTQCSEPFSTMPAAQLTDELIAYQVLRTAYYMSTGTEGRLPWTQLSLYAWMKSAIAGINFKTEPGQLYCCDIIEGRRYFSMSRLDDFNRNSKRDWTGLSSSLDFFLHEIRHTDGP
ncbi:MAG TPA: Ig-like domain-containing protein, partial [Kofleriaceae bacterium]|nr:Ig-like domain-containing protein [Kofleriaceae bacterium]